MKIDKTLKTKKDSSKITKRKKLLVIGLTVILCLAVASLVGNTSKENNNNSKENTKTEETTPIVEASTKTPLPTNLQKTISSSVTEKAAKINPIGKKYISEKIDKKYANADKFELANVFLFKNTIVDGNKVTDGETINSLYERDDTEDVFITQVSGETALYNTDDNSDYYVAYANTMLYDKTAKVLDVAFAKNNINGETVEGCIYDKDTGLIYIPKKLYEVKDEETGEDKIEYEYIQVQFLQSVTQKIAKIDSYYEYSQTNTDNSLWTGSDTTHSLNFESKVQTEKGLSKENLLVSVNGLPVLDDDYDYNTITGIITLNSSSLGIQNVSVNITKKESLATKISSLIPINDVSAISSMDEMGCAGTVTVPDGIGVDYATDYTLFTGYSSNDGQATLPTYGVGNGDQGAANYAHFLCYEGISNFNYSNFHFQSTSMYLGVYLWDEGGKYPSFWNWSSEGLSGVTRVDAWMKLQCAHIQRAAYNNSNPLGKQSWSNGWKNTSVRIRVLDKNNDYIVVGFLTKQINSQSGHGIAKFRIRPHNSILTVYPNGGSLNTGGNFTRTTDAQFQMVYNTSNYWSLGTASRVGYVFDGFWTDPNGGTQVFYGNGYANNNDIQWQWQTDHPAWIYKQDLTVYAHWIPATYTLTANANSGTLQGDNFGGVSDNASVTVQYGSSNYYALGTATKPGYTFEGFYTSASGGTKIFDANGYCTNEGKYWYNNIWQYLGNLKVYAHWKANTYTMSYNANGGSGSMNTDYITYNTNYKTKSNGFSRIGYRFKGWNEAANGTGTDWTSRIGVTWKWTYPRNATLYAQWDPNQYTINYHGNTNTGGSTASSSHTYDRSKALTSNGFTKTGYHFVGWNTRADGKGTSYKNKQSVINLTSKHNDTIDLYAQWEANTYTIVYQPVAPSYSSSQVSGTMQNTVLTYDKAANLRKNAFTLNNNTFLGWATSTLTKTQENDKTEKNKAIIYTDGQEVLNLTTKNNDIIYLYPVWDEAPVVKTKFRKYLKDKEVDTKNLLRYVTAKDREDGDITDKVKVKQIKYTDMIDTNPTKLDTSIVGDDIVVTVTVTDSVGNVTEQVFYVSIYEEKQRITEPAQDGNIRFIAGSQSDNRYYLKDSSNWKTDSILNKKIEDSFDSHNNGTEYEYDSSTKRWVKK